MSPAPLDRDDQRTPERGVGWDTMVDSFLRSLHHELRTPLTTVVGYAALLDGLDAGGGDDRLTSQLAVIKRTSGQLSRLIDDLLSLADATAGTLTPKPESVALVPLLRDLLDRHGLAERTTLAVGEGVQVRVDPSHLQTIVNHLLDNVVRHTSQDVDIRVEATCADRVVSLCLADSGPGLDGGSELLLPFIQGPEAAASASPGLGVGLALASELMVANAGTLRIESPPSGGTVVCLELPEAQGSEDDSDPTLQLLKRIIADGPRMLFQPIVDLETLEVIGYEALARGPAESELERPDLMFRAARRYNLLADLDWACRIAAVTIGREVGMQPPLTMFVNVEPEVIGSHRRLAVEKVGVIGRTLAGVVEFTERGLTQQPAQVLAAAERMRAQGLRIALDDVGADPASAAFLPLLRPDVVKLDMQVVRADPSPAVASTVQAVAAYTERSGALLLAEGIETERQLESARALGAQLGQGYLLGRPGPLPDVLPTPRRGAIPSARGVTLTADTPFDLVARSRPQVWRKPLLIELSKHLERFALLAPDDVVILSAFQKAEQFTPATARRYEHLADRIPLVAAMAFGLDVDAASGVHGVALPANDRLVQEWTVVVLGNHVAAALIAVDLGDQGPDEDRTFRAVLTHDRAIVTAAARCLASRLGPD